VGHGNQSVFMRRRGMRWVSVKREKRSSAAHCSTFESAPDSHRNVIDCFMSADRLSSDEVGKVIRQNAEQSESAGAVGGQDPDIAVLSPRLARLTICHVSRRAFKVLIVHELPPDLTSVCHDPASYIPELRVEEKFYY
jgi:hypothetical protein